MAIRRFGLISLAISLVLALIGCGTTPRESAEIDTRAAQAQPAATATRAAAGATTTGPQAAGRPGIGAFPGADPANLLTGTIASVSGDSVTVNTQRGPLRVAVDDQTRITRTSGGSVADVQAGVNVLAAGRRSDDGTLTASSITLSDDPFEMNVRRITSGQAASIRQRAQSGDLPREDFGRQAGIGFGGGLTAGRVASVESDSMMVEGQSGQVKVAITSETRIQRIESLSIADLNPGLNVSVAAERGADGVVRATFISVGSDLQPAGFFAPGGAGRLRQP